MMSLLRNERGLQASAGFNNITHPGNTCNTILNGKYLLASTGENKEKKTLEGEKKIVCVPARVLNSRPPCFLIRALLNTGTERNDRNEPE